MPSSSMERRASVSKFFGTTSRNGSARRASISSRSGQCLADIPNFREAGEFDGSSFCNQWLLPARCRMDTHSRRWEDIRSVTPGRGSERSPLRHQEANAASGRPPLVAPPTKDLADAASRQTCTHGFSDHDVLAIRGTAATSLESRRATTRCVPTSASGNHPGCVSSITNSSAKARRSR